MKFISYGTQFNTLDNHVNAPLFKRVFDCDVTSATLNIAVVGLYKLYLNGKLLNRSFFAPYMSNPDQVVYTDTYVLDDVLQQKDNVLCVLLGNGFANCNDYEIWGNSNATYRQAPKLALEIVSDGQTVVQTDENFVVVDSPITFDDFRCGEHYDARLEIANVLTDVSTNGFDKVTLCQPPKGKLLPNKTQNIVCGDKRKAVSVVKSARGYVYDFGSNDTGVPVLTLNATSGQQIDMYFGEVLDGDGVDLRNISFEATKPGYIQHDSYICKDGEQSYTPSFAWHGCRYCEVVGLSESQATQEAIVFVPTHSDLPLTSSLSCDNAVVNKLVELTLRSDTSNFVFYPYDCPHREKNGWTADGALSAEQMLYCFDALPSFKQWLDMICITQRQDGALPGIVPTAGWGFEWGNGPAWDSVLVELTYQLYRFYGDKNIVVDAAASISKYFDYISSRLNDDGLVNIGLGDWVQTYTLWEGQFETPVEITDSLTMLDLAAKVISLFDSVGKNAENIRLFATNLKQSFRNKYVVDGKFVPTTQTAMAMALQTGVFTAEEDSQVFDSLVAHIHGQGDHFRVGVVGYRYLFDTLVSHGQQDLCFKLITQSSFPSYGYIVEQGATSLWESFEEYYRDNGKLLRKDGVPRIPSFNHHFWGGILAWFYKHIGWINVVSAKEIEICPKVIDGVNSATATYSRLGNSVSVSWAKHNDTIDLDVVCNGLTCVVKLADRNVVCNGNTKLTYSVQETL